MPHFLVLLVVRIKFIITEGPSVYLHGGSQEGCHDNNIWLRRQERQTKQQTESMTGKEMVNSMTVRDLFQKERSRNSCDKWVPEEHRRGSAGSNRQRGSVSPAQTQRLRPSMTWNLWDKKKKRVQMTLSKKVQHTHPSTDLEIRLNKVLIQYLTLCAVPKKTIIVCSTLRNYENITYSLSQAK